MRPFLLLALGVLATSQVLPYDAARMRRRIDEAIGAVQQILNATRYPAPIADVPHAYDDLFLMAEFLTNTAIKAELNALSILGLGPAQAKQIQDWAHNASLGFEQHQECTAISEETVQAPAGKGAKGKIGQRLFASSSTSQTWAVDVSWDLFVFKDDSSSSENNADRIVLDSRNATFRVTTATKQAPEFCSTPFQLAQIQLTWLFQHANEQNGSAFTIDRSLASTPRRNNDIADALDFFFNVTSWTSQVVATIFKPTMSQGSPLVAKTPDDNGVFIPIIPLVEPVKCPRNNTQNATCTPSATLSVDDMNTFLATQLTTLKAKSQQITGTFPEDSNSTVLISTAEARLVMVCLHLTRLAGAYSDSVESIEAMLRDQLVAALGTRMAPTDLTQYMRFNYRRLFNAETRPQEFSYSIRREGCDPTGTVALELIDSRLSGPQAISTLTREDPVGQLVNVTATDGTVVSLAGRRYLHAPIFYQFSGQSLPTINLVARARQFSTLILLVGKIASHGEFEIEVATILKDKEDLLIPLLFDTSTTSTNFQDILASLSPQQQAFARAYRTMLLKQSVFAFAIIDVQPQIEQLLNVPLGSLLKEIQLTTDVIKLFIDYQLPADLLTYVGNSTNITGRIAYVRSQVSRMNDMLDHAKQQEAIKKHVNDVVNNKPSDDYDYDDAFQQQDPSAPSNRTKPANPVRQQPQQPVQAPPDQPQGNPNSTDYTSLPGLLQARIKQLDPDSGLSTTTVSLGKTWTFYSKLSVQSSAVATTVDPNNRASEQSDAINLLVAISKSGTLPLEFSELHTVVPSTQRFDETLLNLVVQDDKNPIDVVERSSLIVATTIFNRPAKDIVARNQVRFFVLLLLCCCMCMCVVFI